MNRLPLLLLLLLPACGPSRQVVQMQNRINELDTDNVRLTAENAHLRIKVQACKDKMAEASDSIRKFQGILGHTMKLTQDAENRVRQGKGK